MEGWRELFPTSINWTAVGAVATLLAVMVALLPIWREHKRVAGRARNLRLRAGAKLIRLRPTLAALAAPRHEPSKSSPGVLSPAAFLQYVRDLDAMQAEAEALAPDEQDQLGETMLNLNLLAPVYVRGAVTPDTASSVLGLIDATTHTFERHGLLTTHLPTRWQE